MHASSSGPLTGDAEQAARVSRATESIGDVAALTPQLFAELGYAGRLAVFRADAEAYAALSAGKQPAAAPVATASASPEPAVDDDDLQALRVRLDEQGKTIAALAAALLPSTGPGAGR